MYGLGIKGSALTVYAALYSFSVGERGLYHGSQKYLADGIGVSVRTVQNAISRLYSLGLIERYETPDGRYKGIRCKKPCVTEKKEEPEQEEIVSATEPRWEVKTAIRESEEPRWEAGVSATEPTECVSEGKAELSERAVEQIRRVDALCARTQEKIRQLNAEREKKERSRPELYVPEDTTEQERNTLLMMHRYERSGDNRRFLSFGKSGTVVMTEPQYKRLLDLLPTEELMPYFVKFEAMLKENDKTGRKSPHSHYKTLRKWIEDDLSL